MNNLQICIVSTDDNFLLVHIEKQIFSIVLSIQYCQKYHVKHFSYLLSNFPDGFNYIDLHLIQ